MKALWLLPTQETSNLMESYRLALIDKNVELSFFHMRELTLSSDIETCRRKILESVSDYDFVIVTMFPDTIELSHKFLYELCKSKQLVLVAFDEELYFSWSTHYYIRYFDHVLTTDKSSINWIHDQGISVSYVPLYNMTGHDTNIVSDKRDIDVLFIGSVLTGSRRHQIEQLESQGFKIDCFGDGTKNGRISENEYWKLLYRAKIVLNFTEANAKPYLLRSDPSRKYVRQAKGRPFEALLCGAHVLSERSSILSDALYESKGVTFVDDMGNSGKQIKYLIDQIKKGDRKKYKKYVIKNFGIDQFIYELIGFINNQRQPCIDSSRPVDNYSLGYGGFLSRVYMRLAKQSLKNSNFLGSFVLIQEYFRLKLYRYIWEAITLRR
jgi:hypothetical protein